MIGDDFDIGLRYLALNLDMGLRPLNRQLVIGRTSDGLLSVCYDNLHDPLERVLRAQLALNVNGQLEQTL